MAHVSIIQDRLFSANRTVMISAALAASLVDVFFFFTLQDASNAFLVEESAPSSTGN